MSMCTIYDRTLEYQGKKHLIDYYEKIKNVLFLVHRENQKAIVREKRYVEKLQNATKELNDFRKKNKILEEYISKTQRLNDMFNKIKQENESVRLVHDKHVSIITQLKEQNSNSDSHNLFDKSLMLFDSDESFMGFDSATLSKSEINPQYRSYRDLYEQIQEESLDFNNNIKSLFATLDRIDSSFETANIDLRSVIDKITRTIKKLKHLFTRILEKKDQDALKELMKIRYKVKELKLCDSAADLQQEALKYESKSLETHAVVKGLPRFPHNRFPSSYLHGLATDRLFHIWKFTMAQWSKSLEDLMKND